MPRVVSFGEEDPTSIFERQRRESVENAKLAIERRRAAQTSKYYDYLNERQKQQLGREESDAKKAAFLQQELNEQHAPLHDAYRRRIGSLRQGVLANLDLLDRTLGYKSGENQAGTHPEMTAKDRLAEYRKSIANYADIVGEDGAAGTKQRLIGAYYSAAKDIPEMEKYTIAIEKLPGNQSFINESGTRDYRFIPRDDAIRYFKSQYGKDFETGNPLESAPPQQSGQPTSLRDVALAQEAGRTDPTPLGVTPLPDRAPASLAPASLEAPDDIGMPDVEGLRMTAARSPQYLEGEPSQQQVPLQTAPPALQQGPSTGSPIGMIDDEGNLQYFQSNPDDMFTPEALEESKRQSDNSYYRKKLDETNATIADMESRSRKQPYPLSFFEVPPNSKRWTARYDRELESRDMYERLIESTAPQHAPSEPFVFPDGYVPEDLYLSTDEPPATGLRRYPPLQREVPLRLDQLQPMRN